MIERPEKETCVGIPELERFPAKYAGWQPSHIKRLYIIKPIKLMLVRTDVLDRSHRFGNAGGKPQA